MTSKQFALETESPADRAADDAARKAKEARRQEALRAGQSRRRRALQQQGFVQRQIFVKRTILDKIDECVKRNKISKSALMNELFAAAVEGGILQSVIERQKSEGKAM